MSLDKERKRLEELGYSFTVDFEHYNVWHKGKNLGGCLVKPVQEWELLPWSLRKATLKEFHGMAIRAAQRHEQHLKDHNK